MSFLDNVSPQWLEDQYLAWKHSPEKLAAEWAAFFAGYEAGMTAATSTEAFPSPEAARKLAAVQELIHRHRDIGHLLACTDPLSPCSTDHPFLNPASFGLDPDDMNRVFPTEDFLTGSAPLREILQILRETYCRSIGVEFMHIQEPRRWHWLVERMETSRNRTTFSREEQYGILEKLLEASLFESFLHHKFPGQTRFSLEGGETMLPMLDAAVHHAAKQGVTDIIVGMSHRGRLNVQAHVFGKPYESIFAEFHDTLETGLIGDGDVKYHSGISSDRELESGTCVHLTLVANPSHLEAVNPVVAGKCRARQDRFADSGASRVLPILIHGDAAFAGQGIVAETLNLSQLAGYGTGGTLHLVLNNQIGFTTLPVDARSCCYATDVAKMLMAPIIHVHSEDPEAAVHTIRLALDYRREFSGDIVVELICYRRYGHNEGDEPYFTQPLMYEKIKGRQPAYHFYGERLQSEGFPAETLESLKKEITKRLEATPEKESATTEAAFLGRWSDIRQQAPASKTETGVAAATLVSLSKAVTAIPEGFTPHHKIANLFEKRRDTVAKGEGIDWANAESLAFASLLHEGVSVRLSGQDCRRGTFSQRHCVIFDTRTGKPYLPLATAAGGNGTFHPFDSPLSEASVLGFEYGYSLESPERLTIWEAQYGDFANGAQVVIDQFIAGGETKWGWASGLIMLLPHGYEGQGAEHSSARIERFLQLCAEDNIQVAFPSTPAQYFHLLRRQVRQPFRKPLVVLTPKSLLRAPACVSMLEDFTGGWFREVIPSTAPPDKTSAVLICSGKLYYDLADRRAHERRDDVAIIRIEQLYPLREDLLRDELARYRHAASVAWVQEEPDNMGAWGYLRPRLAGILGSSPRYVGRKASACPAVGSYRQHRQEQERIMEDAFAG